MQLEISGESIQGSRDYQEDYFKSQIGGNNQYHLLVLGDGMGGHSGGDHASRVAVETFVTAFDNAESEDINSALSNALDAAHNALIEEVNTHNAPADMGTTLVAVCIKGCDLHWISVGDSHLYHYRKGKLSKLNADHSMAAVLDELAEIGRISSEEASTDPQRNALRSCLSADEISLIDLKSKINLLETGDKLLLASDGLDTLSTSDIEKLIRQSKRKNTAIINNNLLKGVVSANKPNQDNTTVLMAATPNKFWF